MNFSPWKIITTKQNECVSVISIVSLSLSTRGGGGKCALSTTVLYISVCESMCIFCISKRAQRNTRAAAGVLLKAQKCFN